MKQDDPAKKQRMSIKHPVVSGCLYIDTYGNAYELTSTDNDLLMRRFIQVCREHDILCTPDECFAYLHELPDRYRQMSIFDLES